jgi:hypothetical protein
MNFGCQTPDKCAAQTATARLDRELAGSAMGAWFDSAVTKIQVAAFFQVPVGYEDETGFHCGIQHVEPLLPLVLYPNDAFDGIKQF